MEIFMLLITTMAAFKCSNFSTYMYTPVVMYVYVTIFSSVLINLLLDITSTKNLAKTFMKDVAKHIKQEGHMYRQQKCNKTTMSLLCYAQTTMNS